MFSLIANLQKKNPRQKQRIALITALVITAIIAMVWASTLSFQASQDESIGRPDIGPLDSFKRGFDELFN